MKISLNIKHLIAAAVSSVLVSGCASSGNDTASHEQSAVKNERRPNFVWLVSEDNSMHYLKHFFKTGTETPNIEALADEGLTFTNAYSNAPVCSVARTTLATSMYLPRLGAQYHRAYKEVAMPEGTQLFHQYLRDAGYYVTNRSKTDYNMAVNDKKTWNASSKKASWKGRKDADQPFFHFETIFISHESRLQFSEKTYKKEVGKTDLGSIQLADYHPDTELFKFTHAKYHQKIQEVDQRVGELVTELEKDGLLDDTFIFYFSDHGGVLPRGKGYIYDSGVHIPLVVKVPKNFRHLVDGKAGETVDGTVNFVDFGPTLLKLAGMEMPSHMDGKAFLGAGVDIDEVNQRETSLSYADRFDEKYDLVRTFKKGKYHYVRNYQSYLPDGLQNNYRYKMLAYNEWRKLHNANQLSSVQDQFYQTKPAEALFDTEADPHEVNNLADDPKYASVLKEMQQSLQSEIKALPDLGFYPESYLAKHSADNPVQFAEAHKAEIAELIDVADLSLLPFTQAEAKIIAALKSDNQMKRYWGLIVSSGFASKSPQLVKTAKALLKDDSVYVRLRALEYLGMIGEHNPYPDLLNIVNTTKDSILLVEALGVVSYFKERHEDQYTLNPALIKPLVNGNKGIAARLLFLKGSKK